MLPYEAKIKIKKLKERGELNYGVGDIVFLKTDKKQTKPMIVESIDHDILTEGIRTNCRYFDNKGEIAYFPFLTQKLLTHAIEKKKKTTKLDILKTKDLEIFGLFNYGSIIAGNFGDEKETETAKNSRYIYNFKKYNHSHDEIKTNINYVMECFDCKSIIVVPPHDKKVSYMQKLFGETIIRTTEVEKRKYAHTKPLPIDYKDSYNINITKIKGNKILLVDDIVTSGETLLHFKNVLEKMGLEVVCFALGISKKMMPKFFTKMMIIELE